MSALADLGSPDTASRQVQRGLARRLGVIGGAIGGLAGVVQATVGARIPAWTGSKLDPTRLGLLTIMLSLLAAAAAAHQQSPYLRVGPRAACALVLLAAALLGFSTVGRLWFLPGPLLLLAGVLTVDSFSGTARLITGNWLRCLLGVLGAAELLMAAGASSGTLVVGAVGGAALLAAAWASSRAAVAWLTAVGSVPFAVAAWTAVLPVVLLLTATVIATALVRAPSPGEPARQAILARP